MKLKITAANVFLTGAYLLALVLVFLIFRPYITFIILGLIITYFLTPLNKKVQGVIENKTLSSLLMSFLTVLIIVVPLVLIIGSVTQDARSVYNELTVLNLDNLSQTIEQTTGINIDLNEIMTPLLIDLRSYITNSIPDILGFATELLIKLFVMLFVIYYTFKEGDKIVKNLFQKLPFSKTQKSEIKEKIKSVLSGVLYGQFLIALLQGIVGGIGFWIFGINNPLFWGFLMSVLSFIPLLGPPLVWGPAAIYLFYIGDFWVGVALVLYNLLIVMNIDNFLKPKLIGSRTGMHPAIVLIGILGGITLFGIIGFIIGPIVLAISLLVIKFFNQDVLGAK